MATARFHIWMLQACLVAFVYQTVVGTEQTVNRFALYGPAVAGGEWWRLFTAGFLHGGAVHLAFNMLALWVLGRALGPLLAYRGWWAFPTLYLGALLGGSVGGLIQHWGTPGIGASGAIFGMLGAAVSLPRRLGYPWNQLGALPWMLVNVAVTFLIPGISAGAHLGGLATGLLLGWVLAPTTTHGRDTAATTNITG
jgi:membrane associated rhomboid family serine protease